MQRQVKEYLKYLCCVVHVSHWYCIFINKEKMTLVSSSWLVDTFCLLIFISVLIICWLKRKYTYWEKRGVYTEKPHLLFGNMTQAFLQMADFGILMNDIYRKLKAENKRHGGFYFLFMPCYIPADPEIVKNILQTDFDHFIDRGVYYNEKTDPLSGNLFFIEGDKWKTLRKKLTPTFTSGKMKMMFEILEKCSNGLVIKMDKLADKTPIEIKDILSRFTTDVIGTCAFGINCNSLENADNEFRKYGQTFFEHSLLNNIKQILTFTNPDLMKKFGTVVIDRQLSDFFSAIIRETIAYREKNNIQRNDFMHLLLQLKNRGELVEEGEILDNTNNKKDEVIDNLSFEEIAAQAFVFFVAGFETSSTTMTFCLYEVASNKDIQEKLRSEISEILGKFNGKLTYDSVMRMSYLDKVVNETLRKYPPLPALNRICTKNYPVPGTTLVLEKGTKIFIPVIGLQRDEEYYPNPDKFDPERFSEETKNSRPPFTYLPFGEGPRNCIGLRFGLMQAKVGLCALLKNYKFSVNKKTQVPLKMDPRSFVLTTQGGMWLDYSKIL